MSVVNLREKSILAKVVYYGPPLGGKTTSLKFIHRVMDPENKTSLVSLNTERDRTLFFDFLPINLGRIGDFQLKIQGFTVPGQVKYLLTRRYVLRGADAVVFVADSRPGERESNAAALADLVDNLSRNGLSFDSIPMVLEYNKRDEPGVMSVEEMNAALNARGVPAFETVATVGDGVFEAFAELSASMVERICSEYRITGVRDAAASVKAALGRIHREFLHWRASHPDSFPAPASTSSTVVVDDDDSARDPQAATEALLEKAVGTNIQVAELLSEVQEARASLEARVNEMTALHEVTTAAAATLDEDNVVAVVVEGAARALHTGCASMLVRDEDDGSLRERGVHGFLYDPLVAGAAAAGAGSVLAILRSPDPVVVIPGEHDGLLESIRRREPGVRAAVAAPLRVRGETRGLLVVYWTGPGGDPPAGAPRFLGALAAAASVALENARLHGQMERLTRELEQKVADRTRDLESALAELRILDQLKDDFLSNMSHELMTPIAGIRSSAEILRSYPDMSPDERAGFLSGIEQETDRLSGRLQDILDLSALDSGKVELRWEPAVAREVVAQAVERNRRRFDARGIRVNFWPQTGLPRFECDRRWLDRALDHLFDNAAKFSPDGGEVDITVEAESGGIRIGVRDRGPGIPVAERARIWERFKQRGEVLTDKTPGLGAGMPLVRRIVEIHGGVVGIDGGEGRGTLVWMRLPAM
jgi:signal transduction histidine kinase/signal recognition particle receptor subunit beta